MRFVFSCFSCSELSKDERIVHSQAASSTASASPGGVRNMNPSTSLVTGGKGTDHVAASIPAKSKETSHHYEKELDPSPALQATRHQQAAQQDMDATIVINYDVNAQAKAQVHGNAGKPEAREPCSSCSSGAPEQRPLDMAAPTAPQQCQSSSQRPMHLSSRVNFNAILDLAPALNLGTDVTNTPDTVPDSSCAAPTSRPLGLRSSSVVDFSLLSSILSDAAGSAAQGLSSAGATAPGCRRAHPARAVTSCTLPAPAAEARVQAKPSRSGWEALSDILGARTASPAVSPRAHATSPRGREGSSPGGARPDGAEDEAALSPRERRMLRRFSTMDAARAPRSNSCGLENHHGAMKAACDLLRSQEGHIYPVGSNQQRWQRLLSGAGSGSAPPAAASPGRGYECPAAPPAAGAGRCRTQSQDVSHLRLRDAAAAAAPRAGAPTYAKQQLAAS